MRIDKLINERTHNSNTPRSLSEIYSDPDIMDEWDCLYPSESETQQMMDDYREDLKERNLLN